MSIGKCPPHNAPVVSFDDLDHVAVELAGFHPSETGPGDFVHALSRCMKQDGFHVFADASHEEYIELTVRIPKE
jgi:hypothetical protein